MVLSPDLVRATRRGDQLFVTELSEKDRPAVLAIAEAMLGAVRGARGKKLDELEADLGQVERSTKLEKVWAGLFKIILDECQLSSDGPMDPVELRLSIFARAAQLRAELPDGAQLDRAELLQVEAAARGLSAEEVERRLYSDLKGEQLLLAPPQMEAKDLVELYEQQHLLSVLLRAVSLTAEVTASDPSVYRRLFRQLKFRQLLFRLEPLESEGYRIEVTGPFSLFEATTKYGMQFCLIGPLLFECDRGRFSAELRWGKDRRPLRFDRAWDRSTSGNTLDQATMLRPELSALVEAIGKKKTSFSVQPSTDLLHIPGEGLIVPDLKFSAPGRQSVYLELMGYWSRDAVWNRIAWSEAGQHERVIFAVPARLRVSEEVLASDTGASLYVFKSSLNALAVLERVELLAGGA